MSGFRDHFLDKYFAYRRRYVDHIAREAPHRGTLAVASEIARLGFVAVGSALCGAIFWLLTAAAAARGAWALLVTFAACALCATAFGILAARGIAVAARDRERIARLAASAAPSPRS